MLIAGELEHHSDPFSLFSMALKATGLADSLSEQSRKNFAPVDNTRGFYLPEKCELGYTIFAETDEVFAEKGITELEQLADYAASIYAKSGEEGAGWYDYARKNHIEISTGTDYKNPWNVLSMFVRYHILKFKVPFDKLVNDQEYYETMLPYTLVKVTRNASKRMLNRWIANSSLTDMVAELGSNAMHTVLFEGVELAGQKEQIPAVNGYIHPIKSLLVYDENVPRGALNERIRIDDASASFGDAAGPVVTVDHCTLYNVGAGAANYRLLYVRFVGNKLTFTNNIVVGTNYKRGFTNQSKSDPDPTLLNNYYFNCENLTSPGAGADETIVWFDTNGTIGDPGFANPDNGDFTLSPDAAAYRGNAGDPRWIKAQ